MLGRTIEGVEAQRPVPRITDIVTRAGWHEANGLQRPGAFDLSERTVASNAVVLIDAGDRASVTETRGPSLAGASQAALDAQLAQLRAGIARTRPAPQASLGIRVKF